MDRPGKGSGVNEDVGWAGRSFDHQQHCDGALYASPGSLFQETA